MIYHFALKEHNTKLCVGLWDSDVALMVCFERDVWFYTKQRFLLLPLWKFTQEVSDLHNAQQRRPPLHPKNLPQPPRPQLSLPLHVASSSLSLWGCMCFFFFLGDHLIKMRYTSESHYPSPFRLIKSPSSTINAQTNTSKPDFSFITYSG